MQLSIFAVFLKFLVNQRGSALLAFCPLVGGSAEDMAMRLALKRCSQQDMDDPMGVIYSPSKDSCSPSKEIFHRVIIIHRVMFTE